MITQRYKIIALLIFFTIIQTSSLNYIEISYIKPNILLASVIIFSLYKGKRTGREAGFISGLLFDIGSNATFGLGVVSFALCGYTAGLLGKNVYKENAIWRSIIVFAFCLTVGLIHYLILSIFQAPLPFILSIKHIILPYSLYTTAVSPIVFLILKKCFRL